MRRMFWLLPALALLLCAPLQAQAQSIDYEALEAVFLDKSLGRLDFDAHAARLIAVINRAPGSEEALAALRVLRENDEKLASHAALVDSLRKLADDNFRACGPYAQTYVDAYARFVRRIDASSRPLDVLRGWSGITEFSVMGPFADYGEPAHDEVYAPEVECDFAGQAQGAFGRVAWRKLPHFDPLVDRLDLDLHGRHRGCAYYAATLLRCEKPGDAVLELELNCPGKVWLRGALLLDYDTRRQDYPELALNLRLEKGDNLLLVKISGLSSLRARLRTRQGQPVPGLSASAPQSGVYQMAGAAPALKAPGVREAGRFAQELLHLKLDVAEGIRLRASRGEDVARDMARLAWQIGLCSLALSQAYRAHRLETEAGEYMEDALAALGSEPLARLAFLKFIGSSPLYSASEVNAIRRRELALLTQGDQASAWACVELASLLARDERIREAVECCERAATLSPTAWTLGLDLAQIYMQVQWRSEWLAALQQARKFAPDAPGLCRAFARYYEGHELPGAALKENESLARMWPGDMGLRMTLITQYLRVAQPEKALALAKHQVSVFPGDDYARKRLAEVHGALGQLDEALACYEELARRTSRPEEYLNSAAELLLSSGREDAGREMLRRVLAVAPEEHEVRRWLARLEGASDEFWLPWALPLEEVQKLKAEAADYPQCPSVLLLDEQVQVVYGDGSSQMYVRQIRKVLTQDGVDEFGRAQPKGEIVAARTIKPNGTVLEPVTFRGNQVEFPGVEIGAWLEVAYIVREESNPFGGVNPARFYFADQTMVEPFLISRNVLVTPKGMSPLVRYHNWPTSDPRLQRSETAEGDRIVRIWDVRSAAYLEREPFMCSALELIPWIEFTRARDWRERSRELAAEGLSLLRTTRLLTAFARSLTRSLPSEAQRARAIYQWVNSTITTEGDARTPHQALKAKAGDRKKLFAALCHAAGVSLGFACADAAPVFRGGQVEELPAPDWAGPGESDFKKFLFVVKADTGGLLFIDLDERFRPFGIYSARLDHAPAILWREGKVELIEIPGGEKARDGFFNRTVIRLKADGSASASGAIETRGERSYALKEMLRKQSQEDRSRELEEQVAEQMRGFDAESCEFPELETVGAPLIRAFSGNVPRFSQSQEGKLRFALPIEKMAPLLSALVNKEQRLHDLVLDFDLNQGDELRIEAPEGYAFESAPQDVLLPCAPLSYSLSFSLEGSALVVKRRLALGPGRVPPFAYADFLRVIRRIGEVEDVQLTLSRSAAKAAKPQDVLPKAGRKKVEGEEDDY